MLKNILIVVFSILGKISPKLTADIAWPLFCTPLAKKRPLKSNEKILADQAKKYIVEVDNYKISVLHWPAKSSSIVNPTSRSTFLLTHGWAGHALNFSALIEELRSKGHEVIAYDSPAHGNSTGSRTNLLFNTNALIEVAKHVGPIDILVGHSFGCLASVFALDLGKDINSLLEVKKLVLIAGPNKLTDLFLSFTTAMHLPDSVLKIFLNRVEQLVDRRIETISVENLLLSVQAETLIIHDEKDRIVPVQEARTISDKTNSRLMVTDGFGHSRILSAESVLREIIEFN